MQRSEETSVPSALKTWFVIHCAADWLFALPLFFAPRLFLGALGWREVDTVSARIVAAALVGIGTQSFLGRHATVDSYRTMLNLKILWSATATAGIVWSCLDGAAPMAWGFAATFLAFNGLWSYWRWRLRGLTSQANW